MYIFWTPLEKDRSQHSACLSIMAKKAPMNRTTLVPVKFNIPMNNFWAARA